MNASAPGARRLSVCGLVPYPLDTTPSQRFRLEQWKPWLETEGIQVDLQPFADRWLMERLYSTGGIATGAKAIAFAAAFARRIVLLRRLRAYDAVVVHRAACLAGPALIEKIVALSRVPLIFDFDDAIFVLHTTPANRALGWLKFPGKTMTLCRISRHVVVANRRLCEYALRYNSRVSVIPSSVDTERYRPLAGSEVERGALRLGWTGSSTSLAYLETFIPVLRLLQKRVRFELLVHSNRRPDLGEIPYVWRPWSPETEVEELSRFDVGLMPMPDDPWARGKSAMKALLYMAMGIPAVCSAIGTNLDLIRHGENGLLARDPQSWVEIVDSLARDPGLRRRIGVAGRRTVEERYSTRVCAAQFANVVRGVAGESQL